MNIIKRFLSRDADIKPIECGVVSGGRFAEKGVNLFTLQPGGANERQLYDNLRYSVPIVDAAIQKIIRLTGGYRVICADERFQEAMDSFTEEIPVGTGGVSIYAFTDAFLDSLLTYGSAAAEILVNHQTGDVEGIAPINVNRFCCRAGENPCERRYFMLDNDNEWRAAANPQLIVYGALNPNTKNPDGQSILRGLPCISAVLMRIYQCIGQNFDRVGNVRYAVTYKPSDSSEMAFAKERAQQIAKEWSEGMNAMRCGEVRDFVAVGDVGIKVIGADNQIIDTEIPVRQLLEQIVAKLSVPPFLLGLTWSSTERMSSQQADILTSELEFYRRQLTPVIKQICSTYLALIGGSGSVSVEWENINLQDEAVLAQARLHNAQAAKIEKEIGM
ncbi:MAG: serine/threonine protein phosphatase [Oscillospiraceae bacterium]|nr:serine/threonine protein phosphatase [Oscillospiraceae bacterium]